MQDEDRVYLCSTCHTNKIEYRRWKAGYQTCLACGEREAIDARKSWCVAPIHKSNYLLITDRALLPGLNSKGGIVK